MKRLFAKTKLTTNIYRVLMLAAIVCALAALPLLSSAQPPQTASIHIVNNSNLEIRHIYLSPTDQDNWGPDQLNETVIRPGESQTLSNLPCTGAQVKVIGEDQNGCFLTTIVSCSEDAEWTISNTAAPDCGY